MSEDSTQKWIGRNRPPRVQITYDLETGGADTKKELPLVVGILASLAGPDAKKDEQALPNLKKRKFVEIDRDNFNDVLKSIGPSVTVAGNTLKFTKLDDFRPEAIVKNSAALAPLLEARGRLNDLLSSLDGNDSLNEVLVNVVEKTDRKKLKEWFPPKQIAGSADTDEKKPPVVDPPKKDEEPAADVDPGKGKKK